MSLTYVTLFWHIGSAAQITGLLVCPHLLSPSLCGTPLHLVDRWHSTPPSRQRVYVCTIAPSSFASTLITFLRCTISFGSGT